MNNNFAITIKKLRKERNISQENVEFYTGIDRTTISLYENGLREPNIKNACILADFYRVSLDFLFCRNNRKYIDITDISKSLYNKIIYMISIEQRGNNDG